MKTLQLILFKPNSRVFIEYITMNLKNLIKITNQTLHHVHTREHHNTHTSIQNKTYMNIFF